LGFMVQTALEAAEAGDDFSVILEKIQHQVEGVQAYILVDDLNHLVKGGRLSNGAALLGSLLSIKPILYFTDEGKIEVYDKVRTEKKAMKRLCDLISE
ncbi:DegV family EDD domain-containing protein, partial [Streptococcus danieliae]|nr:DegV family EDD domain-containing protein [Streptococcus danieliae]